MIFFFNDTATTEIYTLSLHDALPIYPFYKMPQGWAGGRPHSECPVHMYPSAGLLSSGADRTERVDSAGVHIARLDRKSTRLNSSHANISYAVFCLKKKQMSTHPNFST